MNRGTLRRLGHALVHTGDSAERTALAYALGVFIGFSPLLGLHTLLAILLAVLFRLNRLAVLAGVYTHLPWFLAPYYGGVTVAGAWLLGQTVPPDLGVRIDTLMGLPSWGAQVEGLLTLLRPFFWSYAIGSSLGCTLLAALSYPLALTFIRRRKASKQDSPDFRQAG